MTNIGESRGTSRFRFRWRCSLAETLRLASLTVQPSGISVWRFEQYPFDIRLGEEGIALQLGRLPLALRYITQQGLAVRAVDLSFRKRIIIIPAS